MLKRKLNSIRSKKGFLSSNSSKSSTSSARESSNDSYNSVRASPKFGTKLSFNSRIKNTTTLRASNIFKKTNKKDISIDDSEDSKIDSNDESLVRSQSTFSNLKTKPEDAMFIIKDTTTGIGYDIRDPNALQRLNSNLSSISSENCKNSAWQDWWKQKKESGTKLFQAVEAADISTIQSLLDKSLGDKIADVNYKSIGNYTPLHIATKDGQLAIIRILLENGADVNSKTKELRTPLHIACIKGNIEIIEELAIAGAKFNVNDKEGNTPAHLLAKYGWEDALERILKYQPDLTISNKQKQTALNLVSKKTLKIISSMTKCGFEGLGKLSKEILPPIIRQRMPLLSIVDSDDSGEMEEPTKLEAISDTTLDSVKRRMIKQIQIESLNIQMSEDEKSSFKSSHNSMEMSTQRSILVDLDNGLTGTEGFTPMQLLGKGDHSEIYAIKSKSTGEIFAMKMIKKSEANLINMYSACISQDDILNYPVSPFIVGLEYAFQALDYYLFFTKYCSGYIYV